jgi:beta-lactam-binding protein with PASTA domain
MALPMRRFTLITIIGLLAVLTGATIYQVLLVRGKPRTAPGPGLSGDGQVILLDLTNRPREDAIRELEDNELAYRVQAQPVDPLDDRVVAQDPAPGSVLAEGTVVTLIVRCQPRPCPAPPPGEQVVDPCGCGTA